MCHVNVNFLLKIKIIPNLNKDEINQKIYYLQWMYKILRKT